MFSGLGTYPIEIVIRGCADGEADICIDTLNYTLRDTADDESFIPESSVTCLCSEDACNDGAIDTIKVPDCEYSFHNTLRAVKMPNMPRI